MAFSSHRTADDIFSEFFERKPSSPFRGNDTDNIQDTDNIFQQYFGDRKDFKTSASSSSPKWKAEASESKLSCSLEELYSGSTRKMKISRNVLQPNTRRLVQESEIITVNVKPGWKKGTKITFPDKGNEVLDKRPADLIFVIDEKPHEVYIRDSNDLIVNHKLSLADALAGTNVNLKTLDGRNLLVPLTNIVVPGSEIVVAGEGMPISKNGDGSKGNLKIKFDVEFPKKLTPQQKRAIRRDLEG